MNQIGPNFLKHSVFPYHLISQSRTAAAGSSIHVKEGSTTLLRKCLGSQNPENEELFIREPDLSSSNRTVLGPFKPCSSLP